ncbi:asparaginase [Lacticigenium naphthae]|uniref:asparaginase n=1 Tax=Lacticigenium naphthae TaxID=515351 RepID=UPI00040F5F36|nr:asparaginase [Lacticigenium naphthae]
MKKILILHTGGTIAMSTDHSSGKVKPYTHNPLLSQQSLFPENVEIISEDLFYLPSPHITTKEMLLIKNRIEEAVVSHFDGVVVTHGTDTLEETAYFLDLTLRHSIPIVLTGAMRPTDAIGSDGLYNLQNAIWTALDTNSAEKGVVVVMNEEIHSARYVTKTHTTNVATFRTPTFGPIGILAKNRVYFFKKLVDEEYYPVNEMKKNVYLLKAYAGMDGSLIEKLAELPIDGLVIEALGAGNLPPQSVPAIEQLLQMKVPVVLVSRAFNGIAQDIYDYEGGGKQLKEKGVTFAPGLTGQKARIKLQIVLEQPISKERLEYYFE